MALAPLALPLICSLALTASSPGPHPVTGFLVFLAIGSVLSYGATAFLLLPGLYVVSRATALTFGLTAAVGALMGAVAYIPITWMMYKSSGPDSGPPEGSFAAYLWRDLSDPFGLVFPAAGLITAMLYWVLSKRR